MNNAQKSFEQISNNNVKVDEALDSLVQSAVESSTVLKRSDQSELEKTAQMFVFSSLILGQSDSQEDEASH